MNWILMPVQNGLAYTRSALPTLLAQDIGDVAVLVIDNDSTDGTGAWVRIHSHDVLYFHQRPALGVAASWNKGLRFLFEDPDKPEYVLVVNNDILLKPETYRLLVQDGGPFVTGVGVNTLEQFSEPCNPSEQRPRPDFSNYLIRRYCWEQVGPFDECFEGAFYEDNSYHIRMHRASIDAHCIGVPFFHVGSGTLKAASESEQKRIHAASDRNRERFFSMYGCYPATPEYDALFTAAVGSVHHPESAAPTAPDPTVAPPTSGG